MIGNDYWSLYARLRVAPCPVRGACVFHHSAAAERSRAKRPPE
nr:MAG TPA: hypothetical protein [Caudoviricetes sp.]